MGVDLVEVKGIVGSRYYWCNIVCWGTGLQLVGVVQACTNAKTPGNVYASFVRIWARIFDFPEVVGG